MRGLLCVYKGKAVFSGLFHVFIKESIDFFFDEMVRFFTQFESTAQHAPCGEGTVKMGEKDFGKEWDRRVFFQHPFFL